MSADLSESFGSEVVLLSAADDAALVDAAGRLARFLEQAPSAPLKDVAYTCSQTEGPKAVAVVTQSTEDLRSRLAFVSARLAAGVKRIKDKSGTYYESVPAEGKLAFVFPGGFSFYPEMLCDLAILFPECRSAFDELEESLAGIGPFSPASFVFPPGRLLPA